MKGCIPGLNVALFDLTQVIRINIIELKLQNYNQTVARYVVMYVNGSYKKNMQSNMKRPHTRSKWTS